MKKTILGLFLGMSVMGMAADGDSTESTTSALVSSTTHAQEISNDLHINATVVQPLTIVETTSMEFGKIILGQAADSTTAGVMDISGDKGATVTITTPGTATISHYNDKVDVTLTPSTPTGSATLDWDGKLTQTIDGSIAAGATKAAGEYTGTTTIKVKYN